MKCMYAARAMAFFLSAAVKKSPPPGKPERIFPDVYKRQARHGDRPPPGIIQRWFYPSRCFYGLQGSLYILLYPAKPSILANRIAHGSQLMAILGHAPG